MLLTTLFFISNMYWFSLHFKQFYWEIRNFLKSSGFYFIFLCKGCVKKSDYKRIHISKSNPMCVDPIYETAASCVCMRDQQRCWKFLYSFKYKMEKVLVKTFLIKIFIWLQSDVIFDETVTQATIIARDFFYFCYWY